MPLCYTLDEQAGRQVGTLQAGTVTPLSAASSKLCYFIMVFFLPISLNGEWFLFQFQCFACPLLFCFFSPLLCMVTALEPNEPWKQKCSWKRKTSFPRFLHFYISQPTAERPSVLCCGFTARWGSISAAE